jgi:aryl-alcohol dehydrogenase-like predicted oxidoreductase
LPRRRLGRSGLTVPVFSLGGYPLGWGGADGERDAVEAIHYALEQGLDYFDTSPGYGVSEQRFGIALQGADRSSLVISTKTGTHPSRRQDYSWDATMWSVDNSLKMLKTDYIDLLLVHDPRDIEPVFAPSGALAALERLREQGVIRAIGLGQKRFDFHQRAIESGRFDVILTFNNYHPLDVSALDWLLPLAREHDVGVLNGAAMAHGLLSGEDPDVLAAEGQHDSRSELVPDAKRLYHWCREKGVSVPAVVFQFCMRQPLIHCTLTGVKNRAELQENLAAAATPLPESLWDELAALDITASRYGGQPEQARTPQQDGS